MATLARLFSRGKAAGPAGGGLGSLINRAVSALGMRMHIRAANAWRDNLNPLRSLTISRAVSLLAEGERGAYADLQWLYRFIEKRDPVLKGLIERYEGGLLKLDYQIKTVPEGEWPKGATQSLAEDQVAALRAAYDGVDNLREALQFLVQADFRGFAHLEKWRGNEGAVTHLEPVPQWHWCRDGINGDWQYNERAVSGATRGLPYEPENFVIREVARPVNEIGLLNYVFSNLGKKDWAGFIEVYGLPAIFLIGPPNVAKEKEEEFQAIVEKIIADARGYLPNGSDLKTADAGSRGANPFKEFMTWLREETVLAGTGGKLTMLAESGSGTLAGGAHQDTWDDLLKGKAVILSETMQRQFDQPEVLHKDFPGRPELAYWELCANEETDTGEIVKDVAALSTAGYQVAPGQVQEKTGYQVEIKAVPVNPSFPSQNGFGLRNRAGGATALEAEAQPMLALAVAGDLAPLTERIAALLEIQDDAIFLTKSAALLAELDRLKADILKLPDAARVLAETQVSALINGMAQGAAQRTVKP